MSDVISVHFFYHLKLLTGLKEADLFAGVMEVRFAKTFAVSGYLSINTGAELVLFDG